MIQKIWKDLFNSSEAEGLSIASNEDVEQIIGMLIADKMNPQVFISNLETLLRGGIPSFNDFLNVGKTHQPTHSIDYCARPGRRAPAFPLWFYAAYPDVMVWFHEWQREYAKSHDYDHDAEAIETARLLGINIEDETIEKDQIVNSKGKYHPKHLKNLVKYYKDTIGEKLEVSVDQNSENNIYLGAEFLNMLGTESNFTLIAENTTKYYLELTKNYKNRFNNETSLLAAAGILDAQSYVIEKTISPSEIIDIAQETVSSKKGILIDFIIKLEAKLFKVDTPDMDISEIENACIGQKESIIRAVQKTKESYVSEPRFVLDVTNFMNSHEFKSYRKMLEIKDKEIKKIKPQNTYRRILPFLLVICTCIFLYFFGWIGFVLGIPIAILLNMIIHSILGVRYWNNCRTVYESLIAKNYTKNEALIEISKSAHPELSLSTHTAIINKFNDLNLLVVFLTGALPPSDNDNEFALEILNRTSIQHFGGDRYKVVTARRRKSG